jgi:hypothetical protein
MKMFTNKPAMVILSLGLLLGLSFGSNLKQKKRIRQLKNSQATVLEFGHAFGEPVSADVVWPDMETLDAEMEIQTEELLREMAILRQQYQELLYDREQLMEERIRWMRSQRME